MEICLSIKFLDTFVNWLITHLICHINTNCLSVNVLDKLENKHIQFTSPKLNDLPGVYYKLFLVFNIFLFKLRNISNYWHIIFTIYKVEWIYDSLPLMILYIFFFNLLYYTTFMVNHLKTIPRVDFMTICLKGSNNVVYLW